MWRLPARRGTPLRSAVQFSIAACAFTHTNQSASTALSNPRVSLVTWCEASCIAERDRLTKPSMTYPRCSERTSGSDSVPAWSPAVHDRSNCSHNSMQRAQLLTRAHKYTNESRRQCCRSRNSSMLCTSATKSPTPMRRLKRRTSMAVERPSSTCSLTMRNRSRCISVK
eukprot:5890819-Prymnesium_polylepis.2